MNVPWDAGCELTSVKSSQHLTFAFGETVQQKAILIQYLLKVATLEANTRKALYQQKSCMISIMCEIFLGRSWGRVFTT